jgi:hypothetical protein
VTAAFAEPDYRYHHLIILLRFQLAAFGIAILVRLLRGRIDFSRFIHSAGEVSSRQARPLVLVASSGALLLVGAWVAFMLRHTV